MTDGLKILNKVLTLTKPSHVIEQMSTQRRSFMILFGWNLTGHCPSSWNSPHILLGAHDTCRIGCFVHFQRHHHTATTIYVAVAQVAAAVFC